MALEKRSEGKADPITVMLVDDSAVIRGLFTRTLEADPDVRVTISVGDGQAAIDKLKRNEVDIMVLDIEMPRLDGISALPRLLEIDPDLPIIMASTLTHRNAEISMKALELGAKDYLTKPSTTRELTGEADFKSALLNRVKAFGDPRRRHRRATQPKSAAAPRKVFGAERVPAPAPASTRTPTRTPTRAPTPTPTPRSARSTPLFSKPGEPKVFTLRAAAKVSPLVLAIGSSTGGPQALFKVLADLPKNIRQPIFITQHMPATFTTILAEHITKSTGWPCSEAKDGEVAQSGQIYLAPGDYHMTVKTDGTRKVINLDQSPPVNFCRPSVDPMLESLTTAYGGRVLTIILTGMGQDGRNGAQSVVDAGGQVVAQDEKTSVVWGMPGAVAMTGLCSAVLPLDQIGAHVHQLATR